MTIRCHDGLVTSHKIILAGVSPCIKRILSGIPVGDEVTVIMPDFGSSQLHSFLVALMEDPCTLGPDDISVAFGRNRQNRTIKSEENQKFKSEESGEPSFEMVMKTEHDSDDEFDQEDLDLNYKDLDCQNDETYVKKKVRKKRVKPDENKMGKRAKRAEKRMNEEFDETVLPSIEEKIRSFELQIIPNPTNDSESKMNKNIERNIALQKAYREIVTTGCSNRKAASKVTIYIFIPGGRSHQIKGLR